MEARLPTEERGIAANWSGPQVVLCCNLIVYQKLYLIAVAEYQYIKNRDNKNYNNNQEWILKNHVYSNENLYKNQSINKLLLPFSR